MKRCKRGFTLLEVVLVMVLISTLVVGLAIGVVSNIELSRESTTKADFQRTLFDIIRMNNLGQGPEFIIKEKMIPELEDIGYTVTEVLSSELEDRDGSTTLPGELRLEHEVGLNVIKAISGYKEYYIVMSSRYILIRAAHTKHGLGARYQFNPAGTDIVYRLGVIDVNPDTWLFVAD